MIFVMHNKPTRYITRTLFSKLISALFLCSSLVLNTGCGKWLVPYSVNKARTYTPEMLNDISNDPIPLTNSASRSQADNNGNTLLHEAVIKGDTNIQEVALLLEDPTIDPNKQNYYGSNPFHVAVRAGHVAIVKLLLNSPKLDPNIKTYDNMTATHIVWYEITYGKDHEKIKDYEKIFELLLNDPRSKYEDFCTVCRLVKDILKNKDTKTVLDVLYIATCGHFFHKACIKPWEDTQEDQNKICPNCRGATRPVS